MAHTNITNQMAVRKYIRISYRTLRKMKIGRWETTLGMATRIATVRLGI